MKLSSLCMFFVLLMVSICPANALGVEDVTVVITLEGDALIELKPVKGIVDYGKSFFDEDYIENTFRNRMTARDEKGNVIEYDVEKVSFTREENGLYYFEWKDFATVSSSFYSTTPVTLTDSSIDSAIVIFPDRRYEKVENVKTIPGYRHIADPSGLVFGIEKMGEPFDDFYWSKESAKTTLSYLETEIHTADKERLPFSILSESFGPGSSGEIFSAYTELVAFMEMMSGFTKTTIIGFSSGICQEANWDDCTDSTCKKCSDYCTKPLNFQDLDKNYEKIPQAIEDKRYSDAIEEIDSFRNEISDFQTQLICYKLKNAQNAEKVKSSDEIEKEVRLIRNANIGNGEVVKSLPNKLHEKVLFQVPLEEDDEKIRIKLTPSNEGETFVFGIDIGGFNTGFGKYDVRTVIYDANLNGEFDSELVSDANCQLPFTAFPDIGRREGYEYSWAQIEITVKEEINNIPFSDPENINIECSIVQNSKETKIFPRNKLGDYVYDNLYQENMIGKEVEHLRQYLINLDDFLAGEKAKLEYWEKIGQIE